jgi:APA family basic amino acid/polyamine antiporter
VSARADERRRAPDDRLGLSATVAIVVGGIVGTGIFALPAAIADYGWLSVPAFAVVGGGSLALALTFARLVRRTRRSGGPYAYADDAFGQFAGFLAAWTYWIQGWTGHAMIAIAGAGYAETLLGLGSSRLTTFAVAGAVLWLPAFTTSSPPGRWGRWPWPRPCSRSQPLRSSPWPDCSRSTPAPLARCGRTAAR